MPVLKIIFLSVLLLSVASRVKGGSTTVTLFNFLPGPVDTATATLKVDSISAIGVGPNGGTTYVDNVEATVTPFAGPPVATTLVETFVEAASWVYVSLSSPGVTIQENCTVGTDGTTAECIDIVVAVSAGVGTATTTTTVTGQAVPAYTLTVTGPTVPTSSSAAKILDNPIFNRFPSFFGVILFIFMFF